MKMQESGLDSLIPTLKQPFRNLFRMQLMCNASEEGDTKGLYFLMGCD
jgi:glutamine amidotransferase